MKIPPQSFLVFAASKWNPSGVTLEAGKRYRIEPLKDDTLSQEWEDSWITCGPDGWGGSLGKFSSDMLSGLLRVKHIDGATQRYFALIGCVGMDVNHAFLIGAGCDITVTANGELFAFANDASGAYGNNHGQIVVTLREVD